MFCEAWGDTACAHQWPTFCRCAKLLVNLGGACEIGTAQQDAKDWCSDPGQWPVAIGSSLIQAVMDMASLCRRDRHSSELMVASRLPPESFLVIQSKHAMNKSLSGTSWAQGLKGTGQPYCSVLEPRAPQSQERSGTPRVCFSGMQKPLIRASQGSKGPGRKGWYDFEVSQNIAVI